MRKFMFSLFVALIAALMVVPLSAQEGTPQAVITLSRTACFGTCPIYTVTIYEGGTVVYEGQDFVETTGRQTTQIEPEMVQELMNGFVEAGYFEWESEYTTQDVTDMPTVTTSVTYEGETKQIQRYGGDFSAPLALPYLENWVDDVARTSQWTGTTESIPVSHNGNTPVVTLSRQACFGMCPVYALYLYEDGTVVYVGLNHVQEIGVRISNVEADSVDFLTMQMELMGYLNWQDEYTGMMITDQAYIVTSLMTEDQYKRIVRYDGDPDAPVGLVRIETLIDRTANSAQWVGVTEF